MKFLIDAQLPPGLCGWLQAKGHQAEHVFALKMARASDAEIAARASEAGAVLISKDEDFLMSRGGGDLQFLWLRCGNMTNRALGEWLEPRWSVVEAMLEQGEALVEAI
ncbi:MAG TPA: DUF5615 family PIN-like protein [Allosphingosinicella sp.]|jgi:predicted nuclease of predicted toxin-antitoxin system